MTAERLLALADTLRSFARHSGRDLNAANLFVHTMLMRTIKSENAPAEPKRDAPRAAA